MRDLLSRETSELCRQCFVGAEQKSRSESSNSPTALRGSQPKSAQRRIWKNQPVNNQTMLEDLAKSWPCTEHPILNDPGQGESIILEPTPKRLLEVLRWHGLKQTREKCAAISAAGHALSRGLRVSLATSTFPVSVTELLNLLDRALNGFALPVLST